MKTDHEDHHKDGGFRRKSNYDGYNRHQNSDYDRSHFSQALNSIKISASLVIICTSIHTFNTSFFYSGIEVEMEK